jgi:hypothetical protein
VERPVYALPPLFHAVLRRHEVSIELGTPTDAATYLCYRHRPHATMDSPYCPGDLSHVIEAEQPTRSAVSLQAGTDAPKQGSSVGAGEVFIHLLFEAHVTNHRSIPSSEHTDIWFSFVAFRGTPETHCRVSSCSTIVCSFLLPTT